MAPLTTWSLTTPLGCRRGSSGKKETAMKAITTTEITGLLSAGPRSTGWGWGG